MVAANSAAEGLLKHNNAFAKIDAMLEEGKTSLIVAEKRLEYLHSQLTMQDSLLQNVNMVLSSPLLEQLKLEIIGSQTRLANLLTKDTYKIDHPEIIELQKEVDRAKTKLKEEVNQILEVRIGASDPLQYRSKLIQDIAQTEIDKNVADTRVQSLKGIVLENNQKMTLLPDTELELARLERSYKLNEKMHAGLVAKYEDSKIAEQAKVGNVRIIERAREPKNPIKPKKSMNLMIGLVLGLGLGVGVAFLIHSLDTKLRTFRDVELAVNAPILGTIPYIKTILVTSSGPKEGKSTSICNLGIALSQMDANVIIVDLDMRKPMIASMFAVEKEFGVSDFVEDKTHSVDKFIKKTDIPNLDVMTSGFLPPNPSEILSSKTIEVLIEKLREKYNYVLIDSPPIIAVTDAMILANQVDQMIVVVRVDVTDKEIIKRSLEMLKGVDAKVTGVIVNGADVQKYYSGYGYYYYYYYYQQKGNSKKNGKGTYKKI